MLLVKSPKEKGTGGISNKRTSGETPNYSIGEIGQNTEKSRGDLRRLAVAQTSVKKKSANADGKNSQRVNNVTIHTLPGPHSLNLLNQSWPSYRRVVPLMSGQGYFTFLYGHTKHNIHNWEGGRKENKHGLELAPSARRKSLWHFCVAFCASVSYREHVSSEIPTKSPGTLTHPLALANPACESTGSCSCPLLLTLFCRLLSSVDCPVLSCSLLLSAFFCLLVSWEISRTSPCVGFAPKQTKGSSDWHLPAPSQRMPDIVSQIE